MFKNLFAGLFLAGACVLQLQAGEYGDSAVQAARELSGAVKTGDMMWMIEKMYPPIKKQLVSSFPGGEAAFMKAMREKMQAAAAVMKERGMVVETYEIGNPTAEHLVRNGTEALVVLPTRMVISMKRQDGEQRRSHPGEGREGKWTVDVYRRFQDERERPAFPVLRSARPGGSAPGFFPPASCRPVREAFPYERRRCR